MIKRRKMRLNGERQLDGRNQVYELRSCKFFKSENAIYIGIISTDFRKNRLYLINDFSGRTYVKFFFIKVNFFLKIFFRKFFFSGLLNNSPSPLRLKTNIFRNVSKIGRFWAKSQTTGHIRSKKISQSKILIFSNF